MAKIENASAIMKIIIKLIEVCQPNSKYSIRFQSHRQQAMYVANR